MRCRWWMLCIVVCIGLGWISPERATQDTEEEAVQDEGDPQERRGAALAEVGELLELRRSGEPPEDFETRRERIARCLDELIEVAEGENTPGKVRLAIEFLGEYAEELADLGTAIRAFEWLLAELEPELPVTLAKVQKIRRQYALCLEVLGSFEEALELYELIAATHAETRDPADPVLLRARFDRIIAIAGLGRNAESRDEYFALLETMEELVPPDDTLLLEVRIALAATLGRMEFFKEAIAIEEEVLAILEAEERPRLGLQKTLKLNLASHLGALGFLERAGRIEEQLLELYSTRSADDDYLILNLRMNHAGTLQDQGDCVAAAALFDQVLVTTERILPDSHPFLQLSRMNAASSHSGAGDHATALALAQQVVAVLEAEREAAPEPERSDSDRQLARARHFQATFLRIAGEPGRAFVLLKELVEFYEEALPEGSPTRLEALLQLAICLRDLDEIDEAIELGVRALAAYEEHVGPDHPSISLAQLSLAKSLVCGGELERASQLEELGLEAFRKRYSQDHIHVLQALGRHAWTHSRLGNEQAVLNALEELSSGLRGWIAGALVRPSREASAAVGQASSCFTALLSLRRTDEEWEPLARSTFELLESARALHGLAARLSCSEWTGERVADLRAQDLRQRRRISELQAALEEEEAENSERVAQITHAVLERDRIQKKLRAALREAGVVQPWIDVKKLAGTLSRDEVAVSFYPYVRWMPPGEARTDAIREDRLLAHVLRPGGELSVVELGGSQEIQTLVARWREAIGAPLSGKRPNEPGPRKAALTAGRALRARVLDPVLMAAGPAKKLHVCLDGPLHLVPLEALPLEDDDLAVVGDRRRFYFHNSLAELSGGAPTRAIEPSLLAFGAIDFDAAPTDRPQLERAPAAIPIAAAHRSADEEGLFPPLTRTEKEIERIGELFERVFEKEAVLVTGRAASRARLHELAPKASHLHLATHGYFAKAPSSSATSAGLDGSVLTSGEAIRELAPMSLCGLALAGANRGMDSLGRVPGIITAEELAGLDLSGCELAVLSACETGVGESLAGLGIASLQAALHAAGAQNTITSLWKVDDERTRRLMAELYGRAWALETPPPEALWDAKCTLREEGVDLRDWAGWVLTGRHE